MKQLNIPFKLGMQYDNWEFDLEVTKDRIEGCDSYIYVGKKFNKFLNYSTDKAELLFRLDVLEAVILRFTYRNIKFYYELLKAINKSTRSKVNYHNNYTAYLVSNNLIHIFYSESNSTIILIYGKIRFIQKQLLLLH